MHCNIQNNIRFSRGNFSHLKRSVKIGKFNAEDDGIVINNNLVLE